MGKKFLLGASAILLVALGIWIGFSLRGNVKPIDISRKVLGGVKKITHKINEATFVNKLSETVKQEMEENKYTLNTILDKEWDRQYMKGAILMAIDRSTRKLEANTGYLRKMIGTYNPNIAKDFAKKILENTFSDPYLQEKIGYLIGEVAKEYIVYVVSQDNVKDLLISYFQERYSAEIDIKGSNLNANSLDVNETINGIVIKNIPIGSSKIAVTFIGAKFATTIASAIEKRIIGSFILRLLPKTVGKIILKTITAESLAKVIPYIGPALIVWDLVNPNTTIRKIRNAIKKDRVVSEISTQMKGEIADAIYSKMIEHSKDVASVVFKTSKEYVESELEKRLGL